MKTFIGLLVFTGLLAAACNNSDRVATAFQKGHDTLQKAEVHDEVTTVKQSFPQLFQYLKKQDSTFSEDSFLLAGEDQVESIAPTPLDSVHLKPFQKYFIYNRDSSLALDLYSYNYIVSNRNGKSSLEEAGPDTEAAVLDFKKGTRRRIFFGGPSHTLWDAKWNGPKELLLIGAEVRDEDKAIPTIWQINLQDTSMQVFAYQGEVKADITGYQKQKIGMGF